MSTAPAELTSFQIQILQVCAGERPAPRFGAGAVEALGVLQASGLVSPQQRVTALGLKYLKQFPVPGTPARRAHG